MKKTKNHPYIPELRDLLEKGQVTRREFMRYATLLGMSAGVASLTAGLYQPKRAIASSINRGGTIKVASAVQKIKHPAQMDGTIQSNFYRQMCEYLTFTDSNNVTHPYLLENWEASEDLKTWTLNIRKGVTFNNGDEFTADDVVFTIKEWLNEDVGSSLFGMVGDYLSPSGIEKVNKYQIKLHLKRKEIALPEHFFHYPAVIVNHRTFEGDFVQIPHGTGPFSLEKYIPGEICIMKRRSDYWRNGVDGKSLPYADGIEYVNMGREAAAQVAALQAGDIHVIDMTWASEVAIYQALRDDPMANVQGLASGGTRVIRMRSDLKPWSDNRVRMALKHCQQREKLLALAYFGEGVVSVDTHVSPMHPEYCTKPIPKYDPQKAKELLKQAGYPNGLDVTMTVGSGWSDIVRAAEVLKEDSAPAGLRINIESVTSSQYWDKWTEVPLGITTWSHRPLGTMVLNLAYSTDENGKPVRWNETKWVDKEFNKLLREANGTLDVEERRKIFCKLEDIQMTRGSIAIPFFKNIWLVTSKKLKNMKAHPSNYLSFDRAWFDEKA
ncbi:MAG: ABC transporter substrate-binding protein [Thermodesulfobacteriota bacterium]